MKPTFRAFLLCVSLASAGQVWANTLPQACGDDKVKFDVTTEESQAAPAAPAEGKAQIIFIETENERVTLAGDATIRFGMDGAWVGANNGNSYFALTVDPGVHHLCASWQSSLGAFKKNIDLTPLNEDEGKYRLTISKLSTSKPKEVRARS